MSASEGVLLRWMEVNCEIMNNMQVKRIGNFDKSFRTSQIFAALIQSYVGVNSIKSLNGFKPSCQTEEDYKQNAEKLIAVF